jgi:hypothetical protein
VFAAASSLVGDEALATWQRLPANLQATECALRNAVANRLEQDVAPIASVNREADFVTAFSRWNESVMQCEETNIRTARVFEIVTAVRQLKSIPNKD